MTKQTAIAFEDLRYVEIGCPRCSTKTILDVKNESARTPGACPSCGLAFNSNDVQGPISAFMDLYRIFTHKDQTVKFRIIVGQEEEQQKDAQKEPAKEPAKEAGK